MDNIMTKKVCVFNLGCKVNQYEGDEILSILKDNGYEAIDGLDYADVYIINTCAVTNEAEKKSRQAVSRALKLNPDAKILICGCASQHNANQFMHLQNVVFCKGVANKTDIIKGINGNKGICSR
jgi:2-methylthioadenine synthetase